jgi:E2F/DP family winged-helix DNA-binding domain/E2F transcription factor CC-MB domain
MVSQSTLSEIGVSSPKHSSSPHAASLPKSSEKETNSLHSLTKKFVDLLLQHPNERVEIGYAADLLQIPKRRLYDITNVLEGFGLIDKSERNSIIWKGFQNLRTIALNRQGHSTSSPISASTPSSSSNAFTNPSYPISGSNSSRNKREKESPPATTDVSLNSNQSSTLKSLDKELYDLDQVIGALKDEMSSIMADPIYSRYAYLTQDDIRSLPIFQRSTVLAVRAPPGATIEVADPDYILSGSKHAASTETLKSSPTKKRKGNAMDDSLTSPPAVSASVYPYECYIASPNGPIEVKLVTSVTSVGVNASSHVSASAMQPPIFEPIRRTSPILQQHQHTENLMKRSSSYHLPPDGNRSFQPLNLLSSLVGEMQASDNNIESLNQQSGIDNDLDLFFPSSSSNFTAKFGTFGLDFPDPEDMPDFHVGDADIDFSVPLATNGVSALQGAPQTDASSTFGPGLHLSGASVGVSLGFKSHRVHSSNSLSKKK